MASEKYRLYTLDVVALCRSVVIKSKINAQLMNDHLEMFGHYVDHGSPTTWRYYLNLAGEYHVTDTMMTITSRDTQLEIDFTKANLDASPITRSEFALYRKDLVERYPTQEHFIDRIVHPINIDDAVDAADGKILYHDVSRVASNEVSLISKVQIWSDNFTYRWYNKDYQITDELTTSLFIDQRQALMVLTVLNIRLEACQTKEASQFHVWSYLAGHYDLEEFRPYVGIKQALWLYRNMVYLKRNAGKEETLKQLIDNLTKPVGLDAKKFDFVLDDFNFGATGKTEGEYVYRDYDSNAFDSNADANFTAGQMLYETINEAQDNFTELQPDIDELEARQKYETFNALPTGLLKFEENASVQDRTTREAQGKIAYWIYLAGLGMYHGLYNIQIPGGKTLAMTARDAAILLAYSINASLGKNLDTVPTMQQINVVPLVYPSFAQMKPYFIGADITDDDIKEMLDDPALPRHISTMAELEDLVNRILDREDRHEDYVIRKPSPLDRGSLRECINGIYSLATVILAPEDTSYNDWLSAKKINKFDLSDFDWQTLSMTIIRTMTGVDPESPGIASGMRRAMMSIVDRMTSYGLLALKGSGGANVINIPLPNPAGYGQINTELTLRDITIGPNQIIVTANTETALCFLDHTEHMITDLGAGRYNDVIQIGIGIIVDHKETATAEIAVPAVHPYDYQININDAPN